MKKSRFTEPQIIRMLQSQQEGKKVGDLPGIRYLRTNILQLEEQVWRNESFGTPACQGT
ncbi:hypothetical protein SAMN05443429_1271 [Cruoricaptor ignavus]|uniref:Uncharacterized protein n=1 Tax=Cruoricaptor ignavus TaxID=1118202 RepID=A0A1M6HZ82_9FLAO|nr:hypothetical protein [Cruoricaptor ignavus]SHJ27461.1 hypothetical protein SAMN05443429_1271 [Cruoricaptor ignavus]